LFQVVVGVVVVLLLLLLIVSHTDLRNSAHLNPTTRHETQWLDMKPHDST
jgi:hypothetical protein